MESGRTLSLMTGKSVSVRAFGMTTTWTLLPRFKSPKTRDLASYATSALAFSATAEIALVGLDLAAHQPRVTNCQFREDDFAQFEEQQDRGIAVYTGQFGGGTCSRARAEILQKLDLDTSRKPASSPCPNHLTEIAFLSDLCQPL